MSVLHLLNRRLVSTGFMAGTESVTLADLTVFGTISTLKELPDVIDLNAYDNMGPWYEGVKAVIPNYDVANGFGVLKVVDFYNAQLYGKAESV